MKESVKSILVAIAAGERNPGDLPDPDGAPATIDVNKIRPEELKRLYYAYHEYGDDKSNWPATEYQFLCDVVNDLPNR